MEKSVFRVNIVMIMNVKRMKKIYAIPIHVMVMGRVLMEIVHVMMDLPEKIVKRRLKHVMIKKIVMVMGLQADIKVRVNVNVMLGIWSAPGELSPVQLRRCNSPPRHPTPH